MSALSSAEFPKKEEGKGRSTKVGPQVTLFQIILSYWLNLLISGEGVFRPENFKSTFAIFFCILLKVNDVLCDRRMMKATSAMTPLSVIERFLPILPSL